MSAIQCEMVFSEGLAAVACAVWGMIILSDTWMTEFAAGQKVESDS